MSPDEPATEPAHPKPAAAARTAAAGALLAAAATALAAGAVVFAVTFVAAIRLFASQEAGVTFGGTAAGFLTLAFALGTAAALVIVTRSWTAPRATTVVLAAAVTFAWPLSGIPVPAAAVAILAVGLALSRDRLRPGGARVDGIAVPAALMFAAFVLSATGAAVAEPKHYDTSPAPAVSSAAGAQDDGEQTEPGGSAGAQSKADGSAHARGGRDAASGAAAPRGDSTRGGSAGAQAGGEQTEPGGSAGEPSTAGGSAHARDGRDAASGAPAPRGDRTRGGATHAPAERGGSAGAAKRGSAAPRGDSTRGGATHAPAPSAAKRPAADVFVRRYYAALNARRFEEAWKVLTPAVRARFGGFGHWKRGYGRTISSSPRGVMVARAADGATVTHLLVAQDKGCENALRFRVTWRLRATAASWSVTGLSATVEGAGRC